MFTGIIEQLGTVTNIRREDENVHFTVKADMTPELKIDQSCLLYTSDAADD